MDDLEVVVKKFAKIHVILFKTFQRNSTTYYDYIKIFRAIVFEKNFKTYGDVFNFYKLENKNKIIRNLLNELDDSIYLIYDIKFGLKTNDISSIDYKVNAIFYCSIINLISYDVNIKIASELTGITEAAIKQACQQERLLNVYKIGKTWVVNLLEISEYWNCDIK